MYAERNREPGLMPRRPVEREIKKEENGNKMEHAEGVKVKVYLCVCE